MPAKPLTPEQRQKIAESVYIGAVPYVDRAYQRDPRTKAAGALMDYGGSYEPVASGNWGIAEGLSRIGGAFLGREANKRQEAKYRAMDVNEAARLSRASQGPLQEALGIKPEDAAAINAVAAQQITPTPQTQALEGPVNNIASALSQRSPGMAAPQVSMPPIASPGGMGPSPTPATPQPPGVPPANPQIGPTAPAIGRTVQGPAAAPVAGAPTRQQRVAAPPPAGAPVRQNMGFGSYRSSAYDALEDKYAAQYGIPVALLRSIRLNGERSNADQVSSAGAKSVYQFTPETRQRFINTHGVDPWASPENAVKAAAIHLAADWKRSGGNPAETAASYIAGPSGKNRGRTTRAYVDRVVGGMANLGYTADGAAEAGAATPGDMEVPEGITGSPAEVERPTLPERVRSSRLQVAYNLLNDPQGQDEGAALAYAASQPYLEKGWDEEQKIKDDRAQDEAYLTSLGYQSDLSRRNDTQQNYEEQLATDRSTAQEANINRAATDQEYGLRMEQDRRNNIAALQEAQIKEGGAGAQLAEEYGVPTDANGNARTDGLWGVISAAGGNSKRPLQGQAYKDISALSGQSEAMYGLREGLKDEFFGYGSNAIGNAALAVEGNLPFGGNQDRVNWWKQYNAMDQVVRHDLYGAALTAGEKQLWDSTVIGPGVSAETARRNLDTRTKILNNALTRNARSASAAFNRQQVWELIGGDTAARRIDEFKPLGRQTAAGKGTKGNSQSPIAQSRFKTSTGGEAYYDQKTGKWMIDDDEPMPTARAARPQGTTRVDWSKARRNPNNYVERR